MNAALSATLENPILAQSIIAALLGASVYLVTHSTWPSLRPNEPSDKTLDLKRLGGIIGLAMGAGVLGALAVMGYIDVAGWLTELGKLFTGEQARTVARTVANGRCNIYLIGCVDDRCSTVFTQWRVPSCRVGLITSEFLAIAALAYVGLDGPAFLVKIKDFVVNLVRPKQAGG